MKIAVTAPRIIAILQDSYMLGSIIQISYIVIHHFESVRQTQTCMNNSYCILLTKNGKMCSIQMPFRLQDYETRKRDDEERREAAVSEACICFPKKKRIAGEVGCCHPP